MFLKITQNSQEKTHELCEISWKNFSYRTPPVAASDCKENVHHSDITYSVIYQSLIKCLNCHFVAVKFPFFKENGFVHKNMPGRTLKKLVSRLGTLAI